jgi:MarR family transcriptional regulator, organic hydroperoxide resistance regulator
MILITAQQDGQMVEKNIANLRFNGSIWCNLDIALRNVDQIFRRSIRSLEGITVIEWYILRALYEQDGQHASELARAVGRAATSFTPNLDKLQKKDLIERRSDPGDRRAVRIFLTEKGKASRDKVLKMSDDVDAQIASAFPGGDFQTFLEVLATLQSMLPE